MVNRQYFTVSFKDLSMEKQGEILESIRKFYAEQPELMMERLGADPYDHDKPDTDRFEDWFVSKIQPKIEENWCEFGVVVI